MHANEKRIIQAISKLGRRVTAADVVHETGEPLSSVQLELNKLASNTECTLEVSNTGAVVYVFQPHFARALRMQILTRKMLWLPIRVWRRAKHLFRISFGFDLIISIGISAIIVAFLVLTSSDSSINFGGGGGGGKGKKKKKAGAVVVKTNEDDWGKKIQIFLYGDPNDRSKKGFLEQCFLYLFAEPDPNRNRIERQWTSIATLIQQNEGALTFEQIRPWLADPPSEAQKEQSIFQVLARFDGRPEVTEKGDLVYVFPTLKETALTDSDKQAGVSETNWLEEAEWETGDRGKVPQLVFVNLILCVIVFCSFRQIGMFLLPNAIAFLVLAGITAFRLDKVNKETTARNKQRKAFAQKIDTKDVKKKIETARQFAVRAVQVDKSGIAYRSDKDLLEQEIETSTTKE